MWAQWAEEQGQASSRRACDQRQGVERQNWKAGWRPTVLHIDVCGFAHFKSCSVSLYLSTNWFWMFFSCLQALAGILHAATEHWCLRAGSLATWVTPVTNVLLWGLEHRLVPAKASIVFIFPPDNLQNQMFCSHEVLWYYHVSIYKDSSLKHDKSEICTVQSRLLLHRQFLVVFGQVCVLKLLTRFLAILLPLLCCFSLAHVSYSVSLLLLCTCARACILSLDIYKLAEMMIKC